MREKNVPGNLIDLVEHFFSGRKVHLCHESLRKTRALDQGCPQGSISGPSLWNILLDSIHKITSDPDTNIICFADDTLVQVRASTIEQVIRKSELIIELVMQWGDHNRLQLNMNKTEVMLVPKRIRTNAHERLDHDRVRNLTITHGGQSHVIQLVQKIKYLGIILDQKLSFDDHISYVTCKATKVVWQLSRGAQKNWGYSAKIMKTLYERCIEPIICYGCSIWGRRSDATIANKRKLDAVQRLMLIKTTRAYRTASHLALCAITGTTPITLKIFELSSRNEPMYLNGVEERVSFKKFFHPATDHYKDYQIFDRNSDLTGTQIFTDGSKDNRKTGCAFVVFDDRAEISSSMHRLGDKCSVFQAELFAISAALDHVEQHLSTIATPVNIISDSLSSLQALKGSDHSHPLVFKIKSQLLSLKDRTEIKMFYTRAHVGTRGNERADQLAKQSAQSSSSISYIYKPMSAVKYEQRQMVKQIWQRLWSEAEVGRYTYKFLRSILCHVPDHAINYYTTQFLTDHGAFTDYLRRFKVITNGSCLCGQASSNAAHILTNCSSFADHPARANMHANIEKLALLFRRPDKCAEFMDLCKEYINKINERRRITGSDH